MAEHQISLMSTFSYFRIHVVRTINQTFRAMSYNVLKVEPALLKVT